ncbi:MAG: hypothetical protein KAT68_15155 [Bacteroidales bacterium]|nr:hypothetical protein [Bacteroidales bacterium]
MDENYIIDINSKYIKVKKKLKGLEIVASKINSIPQIAKTIDDLSKECKICEEHKILLNKYLNYLLSNEIENKGSNSHKHIQTNIHPKLDKYYIPIIKHLVKKHGYIIQGNIFPYILFGIIIDVSLFIIGILKYIYYFPIGIFLAIVLRILIVNFKQKQRKFLYNK